MPEAPHPRFAFHGNFPAAFAALLEEPACDSLFERCGPDPKLSPWQWLLFAKDAILPGTRVRPVMPSPPHAAPKKAQQVSQSRFAPPHGVFSPFGSGTSFVISSII